MLFVLDSACQINKTAGGSNRDFIRQFIEQRVRPQLGARLQNSDLYAAYLGWAQIAGAPVLTHTTFTRLFIECGYRRTKSNQLWWLDIYVVDATGGSILPVGSNNGRM